jgi:hypothetical protein
MKRVRLREVLRIEPASERQRRFGHALEDAAFVLALTHDVSAAARAFVERFGFLPPAAARRLLLLEPWARSVAAIARAPPVTLALPGAAVSVQADFLVRYADGRREIVELKGHALRDGEWRVRAEWLLAARAMRLAYRRAGIDWPVRLLYFSLQNGRLGLEGDVVVALSEVEERALLRALSSRLFFLPRQSPAGRALGQGNSSQGYHPLR